MCERFEQYTGRRTEAIPGFIWRRKGQSPAGHYGKWLWQAGPFICVFVAFVPGAMVARPEFRVSVKVVAAYGDLCAALGPARSDSTSFPLRLGLHFLDKLHHMLMV